MPLSATGREPSHIAASAVSTKDQLDRALPDRIRWIAWVVGEASCECPEGGAARAATLQ